MQNIIRNGENGILVSPSDGKMLSEAIKNLYDDVITCKRIGQQAMTDAVSKYSREKIYETLIGIYERVL